MTIQSVTNVYVGGENDAETGDRRLVILQGGDIPPLRVPVSYDYFRPDGTRVTCRSWGERSDRIARDPTALEGDLMPTRRYLADHPEIKIARPRRCFIDFETDPRVGFARKGQGRILCWCVVTDDDREYTCVLADDSDAAERSMLRELFTVLKQYDQVCAWNGGSSFGDDGFDFPVLRARFAQLWPGERLNRLERWLWMDQLKAFKRLHFTESGEEKSSYALDAIAKHVLGEGKDNFDSRTCWGEWSAGGTRRQRMADYCLQDTRLLQRIEQKTGVLDLALTVCQTCGTLPDTMGILPTQFVDGFLMRLAGPRGYHFPTKIKDSTRSAQKYEGAHVIEPKAVGIVRDVFAADFSALYPSCFLTLNASPETKGDAAGCVSPMTGVTFATDRTGIIPEALGELLRQKDAFKKLYRSFPDGSAEFTTAKLRHDAFKSIVNSFYGVVGSPYSRHYDKDIARSVTQTGVFLLKATARAAEDRGYTVVMGDTDSVFISGCTAEQFSQFVTRCNTDLYSQIAAAHRCPVSHWKLAVDKHYDRLVVVAKKKYVGRYAGSANTDIKGLEWKRGDASPLARQFQKYICGMLMSGAEPLPPESFVADIITVRNRVLHDELALEDVVLAESLRKEVDDYASVSPAVSAAVLLRRRGEDVSVGSKVRFVVVDADVTPMRVCLPEDYTGQVDRGHLWENQVWPPTLRLLVAAYPEYNWEAFSKVKPALNAAQRKQQKLEERGQLRLAI